MNWANPLFLGAAAAVLFFWAVGAYNRLMRLRAKVKKTFAALDAFMLRELVWVQGCLPDTLRSHTMPAPLTLQDDSQAALVRLWGACEQMTAALAETRQNPYAPALMEGLATAHDTLGAAWQRALDALAQENPDTDAARLAARRTHLLHQSLPLREALNAAILAYNRAIAQFPALLLARLVGFQPAATLRALALG
ncbi:MAG: hypothetical protein ACTTJV_09050 [Ottowia sp.]